MYGVGTIDGIVSGEVNKFRAVGDGDGSVGIAGVGDSL